MMLLHLGLKDVCKPSKYLEAIGVSNDTLDEVIYRLNKISLGSKITGAGDGGCIITLIEDENIDKVPDTFRKG